MSSFCQAVLIGAGIAGASVDKMADFRVELNSTPALWQRKRTRGTSFKDVCSLGEPEGRNPARTCFHGRL